MDVWLDPLREMNADGEPLDEIRLYIKRKLDMARDYPRESRLFASEILQGAPRLQELLSVQLKSLVDEKVKVIQKNPSKREKTIPRAVTKLMRKFPLEKSK